MEIRPIVSALSRHKIAATLIVLEMAFTCAIICNAAFLITSRVERIREPSGVAESELVRVQLGAGTGNMLIDRDVHSMARTEQDLAALLAIPGVRYAAVTNQLPLGFSSWNEGIYLAPGQDQESLNATLYMGTPQLIETLGVQLSSGRGFRLDEYSDSRAIQDGGAVPSVIITRAMAEQLFPGENALGKTLYSGGGDQGSKVVGIVETLVRPNQGFGPGARTAHYSVIAPVKISYEIGGNYVLRVSDPARRAEVLQAAEAVLKRADPNRLVNSKDTFEDMRAFYYRSDRAMAWLLVIVCVALLTVTAFGIVGLASFWVAQRTHQIGVRRALGGTRAQILAYFQIENLLLTTMGIVLGMVLAFGINQVLMSRYELPRLPLVYLPVGAALLWILGQLAALGPALRAAAVPPAVATRSV